MYIMEQDRGTKRMLMNDTIMIVIVIRIIYRK